MGIRNEQVLEDFVIMDIIVNKLLYNILEICYCILINKIYKYDFFFGLKFRNF